MSDLFGDSSSSSDDEVNDGNNEVNNYRDIFGDSSSSSDDDDDENIVTDQYDFNDDTYVVIFKYILQKVKANDHNIHRLNGIGRSNFIQNITDENWEEIGSDISNNTHLTGVHLHTGALNDSKMKCLFRGLTKSSTIKQVALCTNQLSAVGVRSMVPFLRNSANLVTLNLNNNNLQSEGFNVLLRSLRSSPTRELRCDRCSITSIEIRCIPKHLERLHLSGNSIDVDGCRGLAKLLQGGDATLEHLYLRNNMIDDEGVEILTDALQNNSSLKKLTLKGNERISRHGNIMLLKLVNDISSIEATLRSNHNLKYLMCADDQIQRLINTATRINKNAHSLEAAGKRKMIVTQLLSQRRAQLAKLQGVFQSIYSEINPLHLPEVLSKISRRHGKTELYAALKSSLLELISTVDRKACILLHRDSYSAKLAELNAEAARLSTRVAQLNDQLVVIESVEGSAVNVGDEECPSSKRRRQA